MQRIIKLIPGTIAAIGAFVAGEFTGLFGVDSLFGRFGVFILVYIIVAIIADKSMRAYGSSAKA